VKNVPFGSPITDKAEVEDRIRRAQRAILNPNVNPEEFLYDSELDDEKHAEAELSFSQNSVSLEISGKDVADLSFVDLPGLIASVGSTGKDRDIELVKALVSSYIKKPSCVILLTVACESKSVLCLGLTLLDVLHLSSRLRKPRRTSLSETIRSRREAHRWYICFMASSGTPINFCDAGVLTKPDRIPLGEENRWLRFIRNEQEPLVNHWYCVKQPSSQMLQKGISWAEARSQEKDFFALTQPWSTVEPQYQKFMRTTNLTERLSTILSELIAKRWNFVSVAVTSWDADVRAGCQRSTTNCTTFSGRLKMK